ncbi:hypothetical protein Tco_0726333 [Tanacetum coccineum]|uniref:Uncharacterized protein n=1 Tax=Tanacetum coccineum TaxID=301880 RepID=A0ABQ4YHV1_9ASTR
MDSLPHVEEPSHTVDDSGVQQNQEFNIGNNDEQLADKEVSKTDWFKKPERPLTLDPDWNKRKNFDFRPPQTWISQVARAEEPHTSFNELMDTSFDFSAFATTERLDWHNPKGKPYLFDLSKPLSLIPYHPGHQVIPQDYFINNDLDYLKGGDLSRQYSTFVTKTKAATYEIKWIEDLVHNLRVEDLQLGVKSFLKKSNLTKPDTSSRFKEQNTYIAYSDPKGVTYKDQNNRNRLMCANELHKFSDGTLNDVQTALHDIAKGIRMEYLPKRKWSGLDKRRAQVIVQDINKQLYERRLIRNLEKFVSGRKYRNDLRLLERTI